MLHQMTWFKTRYLVVFVAVVSLVFLLYWSFAKTRGQRAGVISNLTAFEGEQLEASGVTAVAGTDGVLIVDNGRNGQVFWMALDQNGKQAGAIKSVALGVGIEDAEGITTDGTYFYVVSSQSRPKAIAGTGLVRFKFDPRTQTAIAMEAISGLKQFLVENVPELRTEGDRKSKDGGLNIEGLAWDPRQSRLLLGLRSPVVEGNALVVPLKLREPRGLFSKENLTVDGSKAIRLPLGGVGIRSIEYDNVGRVFKIISGAGEDQAQTDFGLWEWNGDQSQRVLRETNKFEKTLKPEGVARATVGNRNFIIVVFDAGGYTKVE